MGLQLDETNALLRTESDTAARLRKTQAESTKQIQQLESNNRELQDKNCLLETAKLKLEKEFINLQSVLESERRDRTHGSEIINDLQGIIEITFEFILIYILEITLDDGYMCWDSTFLNILLCYVKLGCWKCIDPKFYE